MFAVPNRWAVPLIAALALLSACEAHEFSKGDAEAVAIKLGVQPGRQVKIPEEIIERAKPIGEKVVCLCGTCPRYTVSDCTCGWAKLNQKAIQLALLDGKTEQEIVDAYVEVHGRKALPAPPDDVFGAISYVGPYVAGIFGLLMVLYMGLRMRKRQQSMDIRPDAPIAQNTGSNEARRLLESELEDID